MGSDRLIALAVIATLALLAGATVIGGIVLALNDKTLPGEIIAIGAAAGGGVTGLLAKSPRGDG